jgi:hypothetical protein
MNISKIIVSGRPRSGTSLMSQLKCVHDEGDANEWIVDWLETI